MFKHPFNYNAKETAEPKLPKEDKAPSVMEKIGGNSPAPTSPRDLSIEGLKDLLEKNLKWSQIIYEQNRKINNKVLWAAVAEWLRLLIIVVPIILGLIFLPSLVKKYQCIWQGSKECAKELQLSPEQLLKLLPVDEAKQEQLRAILK